MPSTSAINADISAEPKTAGAVIFPDAIAAKDRKLGELRALLAERFPQPPAAPAAEHLHSGLPLLDALHGGLRKSALTEATGSLGSSTLLLCSLLQTNARTGAFAALVDGSTSFDPTNVAPATLRRTLWIQCEKAGPALHATDLLLRDGNLPLILLDLQLNPLAELRRIPASTWYRLQQLAAQTSAVFLVLTPRPLVSSARLRFHLDDQWSLPAMQQRRRELVRHVRARAIERGSLSASTAQLRVA